MRMQMWNDLIAAGVGQEKIDRQPNAVLLELWKAVVPGAAISTESQGEAREAQEGTACGPARVHALS